MNDSPPLRLAILGAGNIAGAHVRALQMLPERVQLCALASQSQASAHALASAAPQVKVFSDSEQLLRDAAVDAVLICTPHDTHAELAIRAAQSGRHVLVEKPIACTLEQGVRMVHAAEQAGVTLMVAQCQRYDARHHAVMRVLNSGELGPIHAVRVDAMQNLAAVYPQGHWLLDGRRAGGGVVISVAVHRLDLLRWWLGEVVKVTAQTRCRSPRLIHGAEDYALATLEFACGAVGEMFATYSGFRLPWFEQLMIFGQTGAIHAVPPLGHYNGQPHIASHSRGHTPRHWGDTFGPFDPLPSDHQDCPYDDPLANQLAHFAHCVRTHTLPLSHGRDNLHTLALVHAIYQSAQTRQPVSPQQLLAPHDL